MLNASENAEETCLLAPVGLEKAKFSETFVLLRSVRFRKPNNPLGVAERRFQSLSREEEVRAPIKGPEVTIWILVPIFAAISRL